MTCCICGKEMAAHEWGNNPWGAVDRKTMKLIDWDSEHVCCDKCNSEEVMYGRILMMQASRIVRELDFETVEDAIEQLRSFLTGRLITEDLYNFILANWDKLHG